MLDFGLRIIAWIWGLLTHKQETPPKPADVVSQQAATAPALAAEAASSKQVIADTQAAQQAQEAGNDAVQKAADARSAVLADSVRANQTDVYADDGFRRD